MNGRLFFWSLVSALSGFLFGFDTVVISGAEQTIQKLWGLNGPMHGFAIGSAIWGTVIGALLGGIPAEVYGRKKILIWIGLLYVISAVWTALATDVYSFIIARMIGGVSIGVSTVASPMYISEISPPEQRGRLTALFQFNIVFGILVAYASNALLSALQSPEAWRWMLGVAAVPSVLYTLMTFLIPESPRWLITRAHRPDLAADVLRQISPARTDDEIAAEVDTIEAASRDVEERGPGSSVNLMRPVMIAFLLAAFNQLSGINAILYFAPRIFQMAGLGLESALAQSVAIGVVNLVFTLLGVWLIDVLGRRTLLIIGSIGYIASLGLCAWAFSTETTWIVPACIFAFIASHAIGQGAVIWVLIAEVFPNDYRSFGQSLGCGTHWVFAATITTLFPLVVAAVAPSVIFLFFCGMMVLQLVWVLIFVPETKGVPLEQLEIVLGVRKEADEPAAV